MRDLRLLTSCAALGLTALALSGGSGTARAADQLTVVSWGGAYTMSQIKAYTPHTVTGIAELKRVLAGVRADGYACVAQELEPGLQSVAVPIMDRSGRVIAAMNVSGHANRFSREEMLATFLPPLRRAADQINHALLRR